MTLSELLDELNACQSAKDFAKGKTLKKAWSTCKRGDWMLWLAFKMKEKEGWPDTRQITTAKVKCARLVQHLMRDERSLKALDIAEAWTKGKVTDKELAAAADAAAAVAYAYAADAYAAAAAADAAGAAAVYAAADAAAAYAAYAAADVAIYAAAATDAAAADAAADPYAADAAVYAAEREETLKKCADICRETLIVPESL